jgi:hypothetical protein
MWTTSREFFTATYNEILRRGRVGNPDFDPFEACPGMVWWKDVNGRNPRLSLAEFADVLAAALDTGEALPSWVFFLFWMWENQLPANFRLTMMPHLGSRLVNRIRRRGGNITWTAEEKAFLFSQSSPTAATLSDVVF